MSKADFLYTLSDIKKATDKVILYLKQYNEEISTVEKQIQKVLNETNFEDYKQTKIIAYKINMDTIEIKKYTPFKIDDNIVQDFLSELQKVEFHTECAPLVKEYLPIINEFDAQLQAILNPALLREIEKTLPTIKISELKLSL